MSLFNFGKKKAEPEPVQRDPEPKELGYKFRVNLTEKNVKVSVTDDEDGTLIKGVYLWAEEGLIRGLKGDEVIFEVTKRSKAFKELEPFARRKAQYVVLKKRVSDYGPYYEMTVKTTVSEDQYYK